MRPFNGGDGEGSKVLYRSWQRMGLGEGRSCNQSGSFLGQRPKKMDGMMISVLILMMKKKMAMIMRTVMRKARLGSRPHSLAKVRSPLLWSPKEVRSLLLPKRRTVTE